MATPGARREVAHRLFAAEFNASRFEIKGSADERSPGYVVTPLGAKANRLLLVGVLTDVESVGDSGEVQRARVSDPTGLFTIYAGRYQPEAVAALAALQPPQYVAVVGKARTYEPEPGRILTSIRPESITVVDAATRDHWLVETARLTQARLRAMKQAAGLDKPTPQNLEKLGVPPHVADGVLLAHDNYQGDVDFDFFERMLRDAVATVLEDTGLAKPLAAAPPILAATAPKPAGPGNEVETKVLTIIQSLATSDDKGAQWDKIVAEGQKEKITEYQVEEALNALMDKGVVYEPILGRLKMT